MKTYLVCYDLNRPGQDYAKLIEAIKSHSNWWHHLDSTWIIKTNRSAFEVCEHLKAYIDSTDELLVIEGTRDAAWIGFNEKGSSWLKENL